MPSSSIRIVSDGKIPFFYMACETPHCLIYSSVGHLGCFHVLASANSAAVTVGVQLSLWHIVFSFPLGVYAKVGLTDHKGVLF